MVECPDYHCIRFEARQLRLKRTTQRGELQRKVLLRVSVEMKGLSAFELALITFNDDADDLRSPVRCICAET